MVFARRPTAAAAEHAGRAGAVIVLDASVLVALLTEPQAATAAIQARLVGERHAHVPHLVDMEVTSGLRRHLLGGRLSASDAYRAVRRLAVMPLVRWPHAPLLARTLALADQLTAYDATYVALAEGLGANLLTRDRRLAGTAGHRARVELV